MAKQLQEHLFLRDRFATTHPYTSLNSGGPKVKARSIINKQQHGDFIRVRFEEAISDFHEGRDETDFVYLVFKSAINFQLDIDKFDDKGSFRIAYVKYIESIDEGGLPITYYETAIYLDKKAISKFLEKLKNFPEKSTWQSIRKGIPVPENNSLISNIDDIRAATLESFWQEPEIPFPNANENIWWEVWLDRSATQDQNEEELFAALSKNKILIGQQWLNFPEHKVGLMKATAEDLGKTLLYSDRLAELRKPRETAEFFTYLSKQDKDEFLKDLSLRVEDFTDFSDISVCLLDTGLNLGNPAIRNLVPERNLDTVIPEAGKADTAPRSGHGTPMAGLVLYGDLSDALAHNDKIQIFHHLESIKLISSNHPHDPQNYGYVTKEALGRAVLINPTHKRIVCLSITEENADHHGTPTLWSAAIDQLSFADEEGFNENTLFLISSGNLLDEERINYPLANDDCSINSPAQAFNAITIGAYTLKDRIDFELHPESELLAKRGSMAPCNTTSLSWKKSWCRKPDLVMEGGNQALQFGGVLTPDSLQLLSTAKGITMDWLTTFGDTSGATALASRFAAILYVQYPQLWPETIRALMIHSADWTEQMLTSFGSEKKHINLLNKEEKHKLLQTVGYGVPQLEGAIYSANNSLTLIAEKIIKPLKWEGRVKTDEFHLFELPWPKEALEGLFNTPVKLKITLSYFIEPNPGNKRYTLAANYVSHGLRFKIIDNNESRKAFMGRISKATQGEDYDKEGGEKNWLLGDETRNKGSLHKDIWEGAAVDLASRNVIAIYPVGGWWKNRTKLKRFESSVRYSLIVSIETPAIDVDIYTPVLNQINIDVPIELE
ncbi:S8 family peptidase [Pedobacter puniceum]|uniref:S8 family serine peptidase n=1 Tax=Pedobacter puniceum TaxID=2666136 RepID=A0A7K0FLU4_9SPHI|nr:S8 family peptidase [Pedobacter puniceum]MRX46939.1 S8 family serine peptidase [Pedobacter puniceum]